MTVAFEFAGQKFIALNGGPHFKFNEAISFVVSCRTQREVDYFWKKLSAGGKEVQCGWLKDKYRRVLADRASRLGRVVGRQGRRENRNALCKPCSKW